MVNKLKAHKIGQIIHSSKTEPPFQKHWQEVITPLQSAI